MVETWINDMITNWNNEIEWTDEEIESVGELLLILCKMNNGLVYPDVEIENKKIEAHKIAKIEEILNSYAISIIRRTLKQSVPQCRKSSTEFSDTLPFIEPRKHAPRVNINLARNEELEKLPGIGVKTAKRILSYRKNNGRIRRITELKKVKGINSKELADFAHKTYLKNPRFPAIIFKNHASILKNPSFKNYIDFMKKNNILISDHYRNPQNLKELILQEIKGIISNLETRSGVQKYWTGLKASKLLKAIEEKNELNIYIESNKDDDLHGVLLRDSNYYYFILKLLKTAQTKIRIIMFFFRFSEDEDHPSNRFMEELIQAKARGVDIKVILDHQDEDDPVPSSTINKSAFDFLEKNEIPVSFDTEETATHTKMIIVDDCHIVIGSHNWTAGSFFIYRDTSIYIKSKKIADFYYNSFESLWKIYQFHS